MLFFPASHSLPACTLHGLPPSQGLLLHTRASPPPALPPASAIGPSTATRNLLIPKANNKEISVLSSKATFKSRMRSLGSIDRFGYHLKLGLPACNKLWILAVCYRNFSTIITVCMCVFFISSENRSSKYLFRTSWNS